MKLVASALVLGLVGVSIGAPVPAVAAPDPFGLGQIFNLYGYMLNSLPPTASQVRTWNPTASQADIDRIIAGKTDEFLLQRQNAVVGQQAAQKVPPAQIKTSPTAAVKAGYEATKQKFQVAAVKAQPVVKAAGGAVVAVTGFDFGVSLANGVMDVFGVKPSDGRVCAGGGNPILEYLAKSDCASWQALNSSYTPNSDVGPVKPAGWAQLPVWSPLAWGWQGGTVWGNGLLTAGEISGVPAFKSPAGTSYTMTLPVSLTGTCIAGGVSGTSNTTYMMMKNKDTGALAQSSLRFYDQIPCTSNGGTYTVSGKLAQGFGTEWLFDHIQMNGGQVKNPAGTSLSSPFVNWYPQGHSLWTPGQEKDPSRQLGCSITGDNGVVYTASGAAYKESTGQVEAPVCPVLPAGVLPASMELKETDANGGSKVVASSAADPGFRELAATYPECLDGSCTLDLRTVNPDDSCFAQDKTCDGWFSDASKEQKYGCYYGNHAVELAQCNIYRQVFDPEMRAKGLAYANPFTGQISVEKTSPDARAAAGESSVSWGDCMGATWENGDVWAIIFSPVKCALVWAFVPDETHVQVKAMETVAAWDGFAISSLAAWYDVVILQLPSDSGCSGIPIKFELNFTLWPFQFPVFLSVDQSILDACDQPLAAIAFTGRLIQAFILALITFQLCTRYAGISIGFAGLGGR